MAEGGAAYGRGRGGGGSVGMRAPASKGGPRPSDAREESDKADMPSPPPPASPAVTGGAPGRAEPPSKMPARPPMQQQANGVKAGEWDDNANYRDYAKWLADNRGALDVRGRQFLVVTDAAGKAVPNCTIALQGSAASTSLVTMASGRALFFPNELDLGTQVTATAQCLGGAVTAKIDPQANDGVVQLKLDAQRNLPAKQTIDLALARKPLPTSRLASPRASTTRTTPRSVSAWPISAPVRRPKRRRRSTWSRRLHRPTSRRWLPISGRSTRAIEPFVIACETAVHWAAFRFPADRFRNSRKRSIFLFRRGSGRSCPAPASRQRYTLFLEPLQARYKHEGGSMSLS